MNKQGIKTRFESGESFRDPKTPLNTAVVILNRMDRSPPAGSGGWISGMPSKAIQHSRDDYEDAHLYIGFSPEKSKGLRNWRSPVTR